MQPRQYAEQIIMLPTREQRREALAQVPEELRELVEAHVRNRYERANAKRDENSGPA